MANHYPLSEFTALTEQHLKLVLGWRNQDHIRNNMHNNEEITWDAHLSWFNALQKDQNKQFFIFKQNSRPIGVLNFTQVQEQPKTLEWGCYIGEDNVWPGSGLLLEVAALVYAFSHANADTLYAEVLSFNTGVIKLHKLFKYEQLEDGDTVKRENLEHVVKRFSYRRATWEDNKNNVFALLPKQIRLAAENIAFES